MSTEVLAIIISAIGVVLTLGTSLFAAGAWMVRRIDRLGDRIDAVDEKLTTRIDAVDEKLTTRIDAIAADVTDLKVRSPARRTTTASDHRDPMRDSPKTGRR